MLTAGSLFSGIAAPEIAFERCGITTLWASEIDKQAASVHARHFPRTYQLGDIRHVGKHNAAPVTVIVGGSPCQDFSQAGGRAGLAGTKSSLFAEYIRVVGELEPTFAIWENVPGVFSSNGGRDFAAVLAAFRQCGARDIAWRTLDAQYFGVPQRRRRVFLVADFRGERAGEILFEQQGVGGYSPPRKKAGTDIAFALTGSNQRLDASNNETFVGVQSYNARNGTTDNRITGALQTKGNSLNSMPIIAGTLRANGSGLQYASTNIPGDYLVPEKAGTLGAAHGQNRGLGQENEGSFLVAQTTRVRRLTPRECARLMGFPDDWARWGADNKEMSDGAQYRMYGNSIAVPVMEWIARRMVEVLAR